MLSSFLNRRRKRQIENEFDVGVQKSVLHRVLVSDGVEVIDGVKRDLTPTDLDLYRHFSAGIFSSRGYSTCHYLRGEQFLKADRDFHSYLRDQKIEERLPAKLVDMIKRGEEKTGVIPGRDLEIADLFVAIFRYGNDTKIRIDRSKMNEWFEISRSCQRRLNLHLLNNAQGIAFKLGTEGFRWHGTFSGWPTNDMDSPCSHGIDVPH